MDQVCRFLAKVARVPDDASEADEEFMRYLQLLGYGQIWECVGIQRLLWGLLRTISAQKYDPRLLIDKDPGTARVMRSITDESRKHDLSLAALVDAIYHDLIRNAFAHSDFLVSNRAISTAPDIAARNKKTFHVRFKTWDRLLALVMEFLGAIGKQRRRAEELLAQRSPYTFSLPEFQGQFTVYRDERNRWMFQH